MKTLRLPAEWEPQRGIMLTWPHANTDWCDCLPDAVECFLAIAREVVKRELLLIVTPEVDVVKNQLANANIPTENIRFFECLTNDTWARDHGFISLFDEQGTPIVADFCFNGWGMKFAADKDNQINAKLMQTDLLGDVCYSDNRDVVLEGGSIESDGKGTLLTTSECLLAPNRNNFASVAEAEQMLRTRLGVERVLWLDDGYLSGDDTDSHIDTLARLCPDNTIVYVQCTDKADEHYNSLARMEQQLKQLKTADGKPYRLLPLPMADAVYFEGERLPATYANFLIINGVVLMPTYAQVDNDARAMAVLAEAFPGREIVGVDCRVLIRQHGSLHCVTMQIPKRKELLK